MVTSVYQIVWTNRAQKQLEEVFEYISKSSPKNAVRVVEEIAASINKAAHNPEVYKPDKFKYDNDGSYRAYEKHRYRVSYRFTGNTIRILRIRHTKMSPLKY